MPQPKTPVIHQTDLFHPHNDPDDHWDLACQYALAAMGDIDLRGILLDYPVRADYGDPAIQAVNQLNYIANLAVPTAIGLPEKVSDTAAVDRMLAEGKGLSGVEMVLDILARSAEPVVIHIVGSSRDIAAAAHKNPSLFRDKCKALYLNAGASNPKSPIEYNVELDPFTYSMMFRLPCPVYWMPCFDMLSDTCTIGEFGTFYRFAQSEILPALSPAMQKFFVYALARSTDSRWLSALTDPLNEAQLRQVSKYDRNMWCTGGFLHTAGLTVWRDGSIAPLGASPAKEVFRFEPIQISCADDGATDWTLTDAPTNRYIFRILNTKQYQSAMTAAMRTLLQRLP